VHQAIEERHDRHRAAVAEIGFAWGRPQAFVGPVLVVPYSEERREPDGRTTILRHRLLVFPDRLDVDAGIAPEVRYRGLFEAVVYRAALTAQARFAVPDLAALAGPRARIEPGDAFVAVGVSDPRSVDPAFVLRIDGAPAAAAPDATMRTAGAAWLRAPVRAAPGAALAVGFDLRFNGSERIDFAPVGKETRVALTGAWPSPSFTGAFLPAERRIADGRFDASWAVSWFGRGFGESWATGEAGDPGPALEQSLFGVTLLQAVGPYRQVERAAKHGILFLGLTFAIYLMFEMLGGLRIGIVSYGLVGLSLCLFYVLLLALSEPFGFAIAYAAAAACVVLQASLYTVAVGRSVRRGIVFGALLTALYGLLFVILGLESYAMLAGAMVLFAALSAIMYLTRAVDWSRPLAVGRAGRPPAAGLAA
ncbi:MAG: cell envelope integrity protein CreD, partial [Alphaproteobacteria bacterium]|nr:cell envelope integrity protein CreD [Alphaproteobacteria bacterium]